MREVLVWRIGNCEECGGSNQECLSDDQHVLEAEPVGEWAAKAKSHREDAVRDHAQNDGGGRPLIDILPERGVEREHGRLPEIREWCNAEEDGEVGQEPCLWGSGDK